MSKVWHTTNFILLPILRHWYQYLKNFQWRIKFFLVEKIIFVFTEFLMGVRRKVRVLLWKNKKKSLTRTQQRIAEICMKTKKKLNETKKKIN